MVQRKNAKGKKDGKMAASFADFMAQANKSGAIVNLGDREEKFYKFGDYNLDRALGGGMPAGQICSISGPAGSGKSIAALTLARSVCEDGGRVAYFDTENKISKKAIKMMGLADMVDEDGMPLFNHFTIADNNLEEMINQIMEFAESGFFKLLVIDSVDSLVADEMEEKSTHDALRVGGEKARVWSAYLPQVIAALERSTDGGDDVKTSLIFVRQIRDSMNSYAPGGSETSSGGKALDHYATLACRIGPQSAGNAEVDGKLVYQGATVKVRKCNQGAVPKDAIPIRFYIGDDQRWGIDGTLSLVDEAIRLRVIPPKNATSHMYIGCDELCDMLGAEPGQLSFNGKNNLLAAVTADEELFEAIQTLVDKRADMDPADFDEAEEIETDFEELD